jgi:hypothetical protein
MYGVVGVEDMFLPTVGSQRSKKKKRETHFASNVKRLYGVCGVIFIAGLECWIAGEAISDPDGNPRVVSRSFGAQGVSFCV